MTQIYTPASLSTVTDELATIVAGCQKFGLICTEQAEFDKYTTVIGLFGMVVGIISLLLFQYMRRTTKERIEKEQLAEQEKQREDNK
jgi:beta-lactamase regulating signal transducer with metallopeptidase domain